MADEYDSDDILSQALDLYEEVEGNKMFLTQNTFRDLPEEEAEGIFTVLEHAIDVSDMLDAGGAVEVAAERGQKRNQASENSEANEKQEVTAREVERLSRPNVPNNTVRKSMWGVNLFRQWRDDVIKAGTEQELVQIFKVCSDLIDMSDSQLNCALCSFILAVRKQDGSEYTSSSIFSLIMAIQKHLEINGRSVNFLKDPSFLALRNCVDNEMQTVTRKGVGLVKRQASPISIEHENSFWEMGFLGDSDPQTLVHTIFWTIGINFGLRGGDEHRQLTSSNFKILTDTDGSQYLEYRQSVSKTFQGGLKHRKIDPHKARAYAMPGSIRCPVQLFMKYTAHLNPRAADSAFYFQPLTKPVDDIWYSLTPMGHNKLKDTVKSIMKSAGIEGFFTNHSLRATTATRLFQENIPEQLIMEQTGHRSSAVHSYKRTSDEQKRLVSSVVQGSGAADVPTPSPGVLTPSAKPNSEVHFHFH